MNKDKIISCVFDEDKEGTHQCPKCKYWFCEECYEMFLPLDPRFPTKMALICPQCHFETYELPKLEVH